MSVFTPRMRRVSVWVNENGRMKKSTYRAVVRMLQDKGYKGKEEDLKDADVLQDECERRGIKVNVKQSRFL